MVREDIFISKLQYEEIDIEIISLSAHDVISTSKPFNGEDDEDWLT